MRSQALPADSLLGNALVSAMTLANSVSVDGPACCAAYGADGCALLASGDAADGRASQSRSGYGQFIAVSVPECATTVVAAVPLAVMMTVIALLREPDWRAEPQNHEHQNNDKKLFHMDVPQKIRRVLRRINNK